MEAQNLPPARFLEIGSHHLDELCSSCLSEFLACLECLGVQRAEVCWQASGLAFTVVESTAKEEDFSYCEKLLREQAEAEERLQAEIKELARRRRKRSPTASDA